MKFAGEIIEEKCDSVGLMCGCRRLDCPGIERQPPQQVEFRSVSQTVQRRACQESRPGTGFLWQFGDHLPGVTEYRVAARVAILDVKYRVLARLLDHLGEIEIEHGVVLAVEHHESDG